MNLLEFRVAKGRGGRPKKAEGERATRHVRVFADLAEMIGWIYHFRTQAGEQISVAQILDPILRDGVAELYAPYANAVKEIERAESAVGQPPGAKKKPKAD